MKSDVTDRFTKEFGPPSRKVVKVTSWDLANKTGVVVQLDQPNRENAAYVWLPYPGDGQPVPDEALEYPGEAGRHSGTYATAGLKRGEPALKLTIRNSSQLDDVVRYIQATVANAPMPEPIRDTQTQRSHAEENKSAAAGAAPLEFVDPSSMPKAEPVKPRREAIPRLVQREVWQRDGGQCVECLTRERLCFDHIVPFSKGGGNSVRNLQLLCEGCNLSKSNRI
jgi:5-methylcytosine-specific restriction endonuclease McrA